LLAECLQLKTDAGGQEKTEDGLKIRSQIVGSGRKSKSTPHVDLGQTIKCEISNGMFYLPTSKRELAINEKDGIKIAEFLAWLNPD
jgi:hypothetical protein